HQVCGGHCVRHGIPIATSVDGDAAVRIAGEPAGCRGGGWAFSGRPASPSRRLDCMVSQTVYPPAPLDPGAVSLSLAPFGDSRMLPPAAYVDPAVFEWEKRHMFGGGWVCVGRSDQVAAPGDMHAEPVGTGSVLLTRAEDGVLHAFANTCRHRGHELLP